MSNHYRRVYTAKSVVDTSPPLGASKKWQPDINTCSPKKYGLELADITNSDKAFAMHIHVSVCRLHFEYPSVCFIIDCLPRRCGIYMK
jgi:hypothetical protein